MTRKMLPLIEPGNVLREFTSAEVATFCDLLVCTGEAFTVVIASLGED